MKKIPFVYIKMVNNFNQKHKKRLQQEVGDRFQNFSEEGKKIKKKNAKKDLRKLLKFYWRRKRWKASALSGTLAEATWV